MGSAVGFRVRSQFVVLIDPKSQYLVNWIEYWCQEERVQCVDG